MTPIIEFDGVSKWYGNVIGLNKLTLHVPAGVTGLLGPNGAGKSTLLQLATGQLRPSQGQLRVLGQAVWNNAALNRLIGLCPEQDAFYEWMTGWDFVHTCARLSGMSYRDASDAAARIEHQAPARPRPCLTIASKPSRYSVKARRPALVSRQVVCGRRPTNCLSMAT